MTESGSGLGHIVVVDDSEPDLLLAELLLSHSLPQAQVRCFDQAAEALRYLATPAGAQTDLVLLDINMPGMDGFQFLQAYDAAFADGRNHAPVVMLTSSPDRQEHQRALAHEPVREVMVKPPSVASFKALAERLR
jgi:CheY-like chemotaxis protein